MKKPVGLNPGLKQCAEYGFRQHFGTEIMGCAGYDLTDCMALFSSLW